MKILYSSDIHLKGRNSTNRLGNYFEDVLIKIDECIEIYKKNKCEFWLIGGDIFDTHTVSNIVVDAFVDKIEENNIFVKVIWGNHDLLNCNLKASKVSSLAHILRRSKNFELLDDYEDKNCFIKGINYEFGIEDKIKKDGLKVPKSEKFKIVVAHALITPNKFFDNVSYIQCKDVKTNADIVLVAHYHEPYEKTIKNTKFVDLGAFGRLAISEAKYTPKVAVIDCESRKITVLELSSAKKGREIFDLKKYANFKENKKNIKEFLDSLKDVNFQSMDLSEQIVKIGNEQNVENNVVNYLLEKIGDINE
ncbi:MAG: metallophosphoesterase [Candidatus Helarchaeota archaeon]